MRRLLAGAIILASLFTLAFGLYRMYIGEREEEKGDPIVFLFGYFDRERLIAAHPLNEYVLDLRSGEVGPEAPEATVLAPPTATHGITPPGFELSDRDQAYEEFRRSILASEYDVELGHYLSRENEKLIREEYDLLARLLAEVREEHSEQRTDLHETHIAVLGRLNLDSFIESVLVGVLDDYLQEGLYGEEKQIIEDLRDWYGENVEFSRGEMKRIGQLQDAELAALKTEQLNRIRGVLEKEIRLNFIPTLGRFRQEKTLEFNKLFFEERMNELTVSGSPFRLDIPSLPELKLPEPGVIPGQGERDIERERQILADVVLDHIVEDIEAIRRELMRDYNLEDLVPGGSRGIDYTEQMLERLEVLNEGQENRGADQASAGDGVPGSAGA